MSIEQSNKILASDVTTSLSEKAPTSHASSATTYGIGTDSNYGHVKLSDSTSSTSAASSGIAASPKAVKAAYDKAVEAANCGGSKSIGDLWFGIDPKSKPANVQLYAGQSLSRSSYAAHWAFVNGGNRTVISESEWQAQVTANGFCPYYGSGDDSSTYRMPLIKGVHPKFVAALAEAGQYIKAGLPNITGRTALSLVNANIVTGAFYKTSNSAAGYTSVAEQNLTYQAFDASRSNSIYGASTTVQPPSVTCILGEYVVGSVASIGESTSTSILASITQLEGKVGTLENGVGKIADYIVETYRNGESWYDIYKSGKIRQGGVIQTGSIAKQTVTLLKKYNNTNYQVYRSYIGISDMNPVTAAEGGTSSKSVDKFTMYTQWSVKCAWVAEG